MPTLCQPFRNFSGWWVHFPYRYARRGPDPGAAHQAVETALREQKKQYEKQLKDSVDLNLLLRTMLQVVEEDHGIPLPKKSFRRPFPSWRTTKD